jgi:D-tyrosyl-tRNA(Tyr) deacylase
MRAIVQRVKEAKVTVSDSVTGSIGHGLLVFLGVHKNDLLEHTKWLAQKIVNLRIFSDDQGKMNLSVKDVKGQILVVSQFTLYGDCTEARRPDFTQAAPGSIAEPIYLKFASEIAAELGSVQTGVFGAKMEVSLINDGPVTFIINKE